MSEPILIAIDTETALITQEESIPLLTCVSISVDGESTLLAHDELDAVEGSFQMAVDGDAVVVGHNIAFDATVLMRERPDLTPIILEAYEKGAVFDTRLNEILIDIESGKYDGKNHCRWEYDPAIGKRKAFRYSLADRVALHFQIDMDKTTHRLGYGELRDVPIEDWEEGAIRYAIEDAEITAQLALKSGLHHDCPAQTRAALALYMMGAEGVNVDEERVRELEYDLTEKVNDLGGRLIANSYARLKKQKGETVISLDTKVIGSAVAFFLGEDTPRTATGKPSLAADTLRKTGVKNLMEVSEYKSTQKLLTTYVKSLVEGVEHGVHARFNALVGTGRTSCSNPNLQNLPRKGDLRSCYIPRYGYLFATADYDSLEMSTLAQTCVWLFGQSKLADAINNGLDPHLHVAAQLAHVSYDEALELRRTGDKDILEKRQIAKCFHPDTEVLTREGWVPLPELGQGVEIATPFLDENNDIKIKWDVPRARTFREHDGELVHLKNEGIDLRVTPDHRMLGFRTNGKPFTCTPEELPKSRYWANAGDLVEAGIDVDERLLRLAVAVQADGSYPKTGCRIRIRLGFAKDRKAERLRSLLRDGEYRETTNKNGSRGTVQAFSLSPELSCEIKELLDDDKTLPWWWLKLNAHCREVVVEEAEFWDSHKLKRGNAYLYATTKRKNADVLQAVATTVSRKSRLRFGSARSSPRHKRALVLSVKDHPRSRGDALKPKRIPYTGRVYCVTTSTDLVLVRDGGIPVTTRNCLNFGLPGGLGAETFSEYAEGFGLKISVNEAARLKDAWMNAWPEMEDFFEYVSGLIDHDGTGSIKLPGGSGRVRGNVSYTAGLNYHFQALAADGAKAACWRVYRNCYDPTQNSPLYGSIPVMFLHDEIIVEHPEEDAAERAEEQARVMIEEMQAVVPDVSINASPALMRRWYKEADTNRDADGRLIPWEPS